MIHEELMITRIDLNCYINGLNLLLLKAQKKQPDSDTTLLLFESLECAKNAMKTHLKMEKQLLANETLISSYHITLLKMQKEIDKLKQEKEDLIKYI